MTKALSYSFVFHLSLFTLFFIFTNSSPLSQKTKEIRFEVIEKFKVAETKVSTKSIPRKQERPPVKIQKKVPKKRKDKKKRKIFGVSKNSLTSTKEGSLNVKTGNTLSKDPDKKILKPEDQASLPIPADEFLITSNPRVLEEFRPKYSESAKSRGVKGKVILEIIVDESGAVKSAQIFKSLDPELDILAKEAMMKFRFKPAYIDDTAVPVKIRYAINFNLE